MSNDHSESGTPTGKRDAGQQKTAEQLLQEEIQFYQQQQGQVENMLGRLGGVQSRKKERVINMIILFVALGVFVVDMLFELFNPIYAVEFGILLVSIKIIMLINSLSKMSHFNFWILHSIDMRINDISRKLELLEQRLTLQQQRRTEAGAAQDPVV